MLTAITRAISPTLDRCELEFRRREPIDLAKAEAQHQHYEECLRSLGVTVISLPAEPGFPDAVFVEDPAVIFDEVAVMTRMGAASRRGESESLARALEPFRPLRWLTEPSTLEGGDVMRVGRRVFVGASRRSNATGITQFRDILQPFGYTVEPVEVRGCLHLKSACTWLGGNTLLANRRWIDPAPLSGFQIADVAPDEPGAANALTISDIVLFPASFPATAAKLESLGWKLLRLDISELMKAEAALTCSSLIFESKK
jgi:dimethylargininase